MTEKTNVLPISICGLVINPDRGEIASEEMVVRLEPKVMQVLVLLCSRADEVVSQIEIFESVWPNSVFNPNLVQRSIGHIRSALKRLNCEQDVIKTVPKKGYILDGQALELGDGDAQKNQSANLHHSATHKQGEQLKQSASFKWLAITIVLIALVVSIALQQWKHDPWKLDQEISNHSFQIAKIRPITATLQAESLPIYLQQNKVVYVASSGERHYTIHLFDHSKQKTIDLYKTTNPILALATTSDHQQLVMMQQTEQGIEVGSLRLNPKESSDYQKFNTRNHVAAVQSLQVDSKNHLYYLGLVEGRSVIFKESLNDPTLIQRQELALHYEPFALTVMAAQERIAVLAFDSQRNRQVLLIRSLSSSQWQEVATFEQHYFLMSWLEQQKAFLLSDGKQVVLHRLEGGSNIVQSNAAFALSELNHASKDNKILATQQLRNSNILAIPYRLSETGSLQLGGQEPVISNSTQLDYAAASNSQTEEVAFLSNRAGKPQLFLQHRNSHEVLFSNADEHELISKPLWSPSSNKLALTANGQILTIDIQNKVQRLHQSEVFIDQVVGWYSKHQKLLCTAIIDGQAWLVNYDMRSQSLEKLQLQHSPWAALTTNDQVVTIQNHQLTILESEQKTALPEGKVVAIVTSSNQVWIQLVTDGTHFIWRYDLLTHQLLQGIELEEDSLMLESVDTKNGRLFFSQEQRVDDIVEIEFVD